jgi:MoxR-like ATPase
MKYKKLFSPKMTELLEATDAPQDRKGDTRTGSVYVYTDEIILAVNIALATGRPLLVRGPSGAGKSSLARNVAKVMGWRYYEKVISSQTKAKDLLWEVDLLRRLQDAQIGNLQSDFTPYIIPGVLWWAFDSVSARCRGMLGQKETSAQQLDDPSEGGDGECAVVLLDEIDKADPDVPNNLLVPCGSLTFQVEETGVRVNAKQAPLLILTTNDERELPPAFLRRCIELKVQLPDKAELLKIGVAHFGKGKYRLLEEIAEMVVQSPGHDRAEIQRASPAEYLDTVRACLKLGIEPGSEQWENLAKATLWKQNRPQTTVV